MNIVLVHGFISAGKIFFYIKKKLEAQGHKCFAPTLKPIDAKYGIEDLGIKLNHYKGGYSITFKDECGDINEMRLYDANKKLIALMYKKEQ